jgi:acylphosphatase
MTDQNSEQNSVRDNDLVRIHAYVSGQVQGVGFRWFVERIGMKMNLSGWVRNLTDGRVELEVEGPRPRIETFIEEVERGPIASRVDSVVTAEKSVTGESGFRIDM